MNVSFVSIIKKLYERLIRATLIFSQCKESFDFMSGTIHNVIELNYVFFN